MIKQLSIQSFKAFGKKVRVPLAPITLLYGQNSSGKSSILHSLSLLRQSMEESSSGEMLLPRKDKGLVDLGSYPEMVFDHDLDRELSIGVVIDKIWLSGGYQYLVGEDRLPIQAGLEWTFTRKSIASEIKLDSINLLDGISSDAVARFEVEFQKRGKFRETQGKSRGLQFWESNDRVARLSNSSIRRSPIWAYGYNLLVSDKSSGQLRFELKALEAELVARAPSKYSTAENQFEDNRRLEILHQVRLLGSLLSDLSVANYLQYLEDSDEHTGLTLEWLSPNESSRHYQESMLPRVASPEVRRLLETVNTIAPTSIAASTGIQVMEAIGSVFPLGPFRMPPARWYVFTGTTPKGVGSQGEGMPALLFRNNSIQERVNYWLERLDTGYAVSLEPVGGRNPDLFEVLLRDLRRSSEVFVGLPDVGFGISQLLPMIVQSLVGVNQTITIEQPEVHLHPKLQADLGDLFVEAIGAPNGSQFLIETHSEHLALRLLKHIRQGKLQPSDLSIVYIERTPTGADVMPIRVDNEGRFIDNFPGGFFPERLAELL